MTDSWFRGEENNRHCVPSC